MVLDLQLQKPLTRLAFIILVLAALTFLLAHSFSVYAVGTLADVRLPVGRDMLLVPVEHFPGSPRLRARLANAELAERTPELARAEQSAETAASLIPWNYQYHVTLAKVRVANQDLPRAEESLREAQRLAPSNKDVRYKLGNLLVRRGKLRDALEHFRVAVAGGGQLLGSTLDLVWRASGGNADAVEYVAGVETAGRLELASFFLKQERIDDGARAFSQVAPADRLADARSAAFLNSLIQRGNFPLAHSLWSEVTGRSPEIVSNSGFESEIFQQFSQFDWSLAKSDYARVNIDTYTSHSGSRSLRVDFVGRDTTRLENEVRQLVVFNAGARYRLEAFAKSEHLITEGPRVVVTTATNEVLAESEPVSSGSSGWQRIAIEFAVPASASSTAAGYVSLKRKPRNPIYEEPTRGTVWLDDVTIQEQPAK
jgi:hypothetical protein